MQHYGNELSALPEGRLLVDLCTITWGGYSAEAESSYWCGRTWRTWLKCKARLGKALRFLSTSSSGCGEIATGLRHASPLISSSTPGARRRFAPPPERAAGSDMLSGSRGSTGSGLGTPYAQAGYAANEGASCSFASVGGGADKTRGRWSVGRSSSPEKQQVYIIQSTKKKEQQQNWTLTSGEPNTT